MQYTRNGFMIPRYCPICKHPHAPNAHSKPLPKWGEKYKDARVETKTLKKYSQEADTSSSFNVSVPTTGYSELSKYQQKEWKEIEKEDKKFWKEIEKHEITYRGRVISFRQLGGGWHKDYSFSCERIEDFEGLIPSIAVKLHTRKDVQSMIDQGDILRLQGKLKRGKPLEPKKIYNETKGTMVRF